VAFTALSLFRGVFQMGGIHMFATSRRFVILLLGSAAAVVCSGCVVAVSDTRLASLPIAEPVTSSGAVATLIIARKKEFCGSALQYVIEFDGRQVVALWQGENTRFQIPTGEHRLTASGTIMNLGIPFFSPPPKSISTTIVQNFDTGREYRVLLFSKCFKDESALEIVESWPQGVNLDPKKFVAPGGETAKAATPRN
jgi:hypothetical protein